jgi:hypothetical protein
MNPGNITVIGTFGRKGEIRMYLVEKTIAIEKLTKEQGFFPVSQPSTLQHLIRTYQEIKAQEWQGAEKPRTGNAYRTTHLVQGCSTVENTAGNNYTSQQWFHAAALKGLQHEYRTWLA